MFVLTEDIQNAIRVATEKFGTKRALAQAAGCHHSLIGKLVKPKPDRNSIHFKVLKGLYPHIAEHLSPETRHEAEEYLRLNRRLATTMARTHEVIPPGVSKEIDRLQSEITELKRGSLNWDCRDDMGQELSIEARLVAENFDTLPDPVKRHILAEVVKHRYSAN